MVHLYLNSITIRQAPSLRERIELAAACGYDGLELWMHEVAPEKLTPQDRIEVETRYGAIPEAGGFSIGEILRMTDGLRMAVAGLCPATHAALNWHKCSGSEPAWQSIEATIDTCAELRAGYVILPMLDDDADAIRTADNLAGLGQYARSKSVRLGFEPVGHIRSISRLEDAAKILERAGSSESTGLIVDLFHFFRAGHCIDDLAQFDTGQILIVHLNNALDLSREGLLGHCHRVYPDRGKWDLAGFLDTLHAAGYEGDFAVEILNPDYWSQDARVIAKTACEVSRHALVEAGYENGARQSGH